MSDGAVVVVVFGVLAVWSSYLMFLVITGAGQKKPTQNQGGRKILRDAGPYYAAPPRSGRPGSPVVADEVDIYYYPN